MSNDDAPPAVSVLMPAFRAAATLPAAVASVQAQTFADWELLIVDDASDDATAGTVARLAEAEPRIRALHLGLNGGAARARNRALAMARGRYIAFLDADDLWLPGKLERQIGFMRETGTALTYAGYFIESPGGHRSRIRVPPRVTHDALLRGNVIGCLTAVYDSAVLGKVEMPDIRMRQDFGLWLRILARIPEARGLDEPLAVYRRRSGSLSSSIWRRVAGNWMLFRRSEGLGRLAAARFLVTGLVNRLLARLGF